MAPFPCKLLFGLFSEPVRRIIPRNFFTPPGNGYSTAMEQILKSLILMGVGMGTVFAFLVLLAFVLAGSAHIVPKLSFMMPDPEPAKPKAPAPKSDDGASIALAIAAALRRRG